MCSRPPRADEGMTTVGVLSPTPGTRTPQAARVLARATRGQDGRGEVALGPNREAIEEQKSDTAREHAAIRSRPRAASA